MDSLLEAGHIVVQVGTIVGDLVPVPFLAQALSIVAGIVARAEQAEHNKATCSRLAARVKIANDTIAQMPRQNLVDNPAMEAFVVVLRDVSVFVEKASRVSSFVRWLNAGEVRSTFDSLTSRLDICIADLGLNTLARTNRQAVEDRECLDRDMAEMRVFMSSIDNGLASVDNRLEALIEVVRSRDVSQDVLAASRIAPSELSDADAADGLPVRLSRSVTRRVWRYQNVADKNFGPVDGSILDELTKEVALLRQLEQCQYVVNVYGTAQIHGRLHLIMEYYQNGALDEYLAKSSLGWPERLDIALDIARGMCFLHEVGILHHDLRSANVLLNDRLQARISNFRTSRTEEDVSRSVVDDMQRIRWTAPEKAKDSKLAFSKNCDVYSFGMLLWEIASGGPPFAALDAIQAYRKLVTGSREAPPADTPPMYAEAMQSAWCSEPQKRPTMSELFLKLKGAKDSYKPHPFPPTTLASTSAAVNAPGLDFEDDFENLRIGDDLDDESEALPPLADGIQAHNAKDHDRAWGIFQGHTDRNDDLNAMYWVAYYLYRGLGSQEMNAQLALKFWERAANAGQPDAQLRFGACLMQGSDGLTRDVPGGFAWIKKAADQGNIAAQFNVGDLYRSGRVKSVGKDDALGRKYLGLAAKQGHPNAKQICDKWLIGY